MTATMIVMLIWIGPVHGGAATIQGFNTMGACEVAKSKVVEFYGPIPYSPSGVQLKCIELAR